MDYTTDASPLAAAAARSAFSGSRDIPAPPQAGLLSDIIHDLRMNNDTLARFEAELTQTNLRIFGPPPPATEPGGLAKGSSTSPSTTAHELGSIVREQRRYLREIEGQIQRLINGL